MERTGEEGGISEVRKGRRKENRRKTREAREAEKVIGQIE